jgi:hypothetical protein
MKVARCAAARKLLQPAWAIATKRQIFNLTHGQVRPVPNALAATSTPCLPASRHVRATYDQPI